MHDTDKKYLTLELGPKVLIMGTGYLKTYMNLLSSNKQSQVMIKAASFNLQFFLFIPYFWYQTC